MVKIPVNGAPVHIGAFSEQHMRVDESDLDYKHLKYSYSKT